MVAESNPAPVNHDQMFGGWSDTPDPSTATKTPDTVSASPKAPRSDEDLVSHLFSDAAAEGKKPKVSDLVTPMVGAVRTHLANQGQRIIHTEGAFWRYGATSAIWAEVSADWVSQLVHRIFVALSGMSPTRTYVIEVCDALRREVHVEPAPWRELSRNIVVFRDKIIDLDCGAEIEPSPDLYLREENSINQPWDPTALCPIWDATIDRLMQHVTDPQERNATIGLIEEWMGASFLRVNRPRPISRALIFWGPARTGKSTILKVLTNVWGAERRTGASIRDLSKTFGLQSFIGKALWLRDEIPDSTGRSGNDENLDAETFKTLVTNEPVTINRKFLDTWQGRLNITVGIVCNNLPRLGESPEAMHDRIIFVPMNTRISDASNDHTLDAKLTAEIPGIIQKIWRAGLRLQARGHYDIPVWLKQKQEDIQIEQDPFKDFVIHALVADPVGNANNFVKISDVISAYRGYIALTSGRKEAERSPIAARIVGRRLGELLAHTHQHRVNHNTTRVRLGCAFTTTGVAWLDAGLKIEDTNYSTDQKRLAEATGTLGVVVPLTKPKG